MSHPPTASWTDQEVLRRLQHLGDALAASVGHTDPSHLNPYRAPQRSHDDWRQQMQLLEELGLLLSDDVASRPAFVGWMSLYLKNALLALLQSPRVAVSRGCMAVLHCLVVRSSAAHRAAVSSVCSWFLTPLLRLAASPSSAYVVSSSAARLLHDVANGCLVTLEGLNTVFSACAAVSAPVRRHAIVVLQTYLQAARGTGHQLASSAYTEALHRVLRDGVADADGEVRAGARRCFWTLHLLEPACAATLLLILPLSVRRQLAEERGDTLKGLQAVVAGGTSASSLAPSSTPKLRSRTSQQQQLQHRAASRTVTLKDELQAAAASRARSLNARTPSPAKGHQQLLVLAKDVPYDPDRRLITAGRAPAGGGQHAGRSPSRPLSLLSSMESTDWSVRRAALLRARQLCEEDRLSDAVPTLFSFLLPRLQDTHFRVVEAAQELLRCCLRTCPSSTQQLLHDSMPELLGALVRNSTHAKPAVADGAFTLLDVVARQHASPSRLLEALLRCVDDVRGDAAVQRGAEFVHYLVRLHFSLLSQVPMMGAVVRSAVTHLSAAAAAVAGGGPSAAAHRAGGIGCGMAWSQVLAAAALACPDVFQSTFERLSQEQQAVVRTALQACFAAVSSSGAPGGLVEEVPCAFAEQLRLSYAAAVRRSSAHGRGEHAATAGKADSGPVCTPLPDTPSRRAFPSFVRRLLTKEDSGKDLGAVRGAQLNQVPSGTSPTDGCTPRCNYESGEGPSIATPNAAPSLVFARSSSDGANNSGGRGSTFLNAALPTVEAPLALHGNCNSSPCFDAEGGGDADLPRNPPAYFLREWAACKDAAAKCTALLSLSSVLTRYTARQRSSSGGGVWDGAAPECLPEDVQHMLVLWEREVSGADHGSDHKLRWAVFEALDALLAWPLARSAVARQLNRVVSACRLGMDDAFLEVQLQAAACLETALLRRKIPCDLCLGALASCLGKWIEGPTKDAVSPGWVELLHAMRRLFEDGQRTAEVKVVKGAAERPVQHLQDVDGYGDGGGGGALTLPASVLRRVTAVVCRCLGHCNPVVRLSAVLVLVAVQHTMGETSAASFLTMLTPAQHRVVVWYRSKTLEADGEGRF